MSDLDLDLSRSLKVKCNGAVRLSILPRANFSQNRITSCLGPREAPHEVDWLNTFCAMLLTDTYTHTRTHNMIARKPWRGLIT